MSGLIHGVLIVRDDFDSKKPDLESQISKALGVPWTVSIDAAAVLQHADDGYAKQNPGSMFTAFVFLNTIRHDLSNISRWYLGCWMPAPTLT